MHLPKSVYEYAPHYWIVVGVLLVLVGLREGSQGNPVFQYASVALGALSCVWGATIFLLRRARRQPDAANAPAD